MRDTSFLEVSFGGSVCAIPFAKSPLTDCGMYLCPIIDRSFCKSILFIYFLQEFNKKCSATTISRNKRRCLNCKRSAFNPHTFCTKQDHKPFQPIFAAKGLKCSSFTYFTSIKKSPKRWPTNRYQSTIYAQSSALFAQRIVRK